MGKGHFTLFYFLTLLIICCDLLGNKYSYYSTGGYTFVVERNKKR